MIVRICILVIALGWLATGPVPQVDAAQRSALSMVDYAPRLPLPSEPPAEAQPLAQAALFISLAFVVGAVVVLIVYVRRRERPDRQAKRTAEGFIGWR